jgi:hypothetical protein
MAANDRQVGGNHYKSPYEHWDWVLKIGMGYLEGVATKYIARWDKAPKPLQDLQKSGHYIEKTLEQIAVAQRQYILRPDRHVIVAETERFAAANGITGEAYSALTSLALWCEASDLQSARAAVDRLIASIPAKPVPLEDSNKHAERTDRNNT